MPNAPILLYPLERPEIQRSVLGVKAWEYSQKKWVKSPVKFLAVKKQLNQANELQLCFKSR